MTATNKLHEYLEGLRNCGSSSATTTADLLDSVVLSAKYDQENEATILDLVAAECDELMAAARAAKKFVQQLR